MMIRFALLAVALALPAHAETWPRFPITQAFRDSGKAQAKRYKETGQNADPMGWRHKPDGEYLGYSRRTRQYRNKDRIKLDEKGLPQVKYAGEFYYNPVTMAQYALANHGLFVTKGEGKEKFLAAAEWLLGRTSSEGAIAIEYPYQHYTQAQPYGKRNTAGGLGYGQILSVFARAYSVTRDARYLEVGNKVLHAMNRHMPHGPRADLSDLDPSLSGYIWFKEYPVRPYVYTLNGYMFALLGLYDWGQIAKSSEAENTFKRGIETLVKILPYYDLETFSTYDLSYITYGYLQPYLKPLPPKFAARYHRVHIGQLRNLYSVTGNQTLKIYADRWQRYVE